MSRNLKWNALQKCTSPLNGIRDLLYLYPDTSNCEWSNEKARACWRLLRALSICIVNSRIHWLNNRTDFIMRKENRSFPWMISHWNLPVDIKSGKPRVETQNFIESKKNFWLLADRVGMTMGTWPINSNGFISEGTSTNWNNKLSRPLDQLLGEWAP